MGSLKTLESFYWVFTHNCNLRCAHCYNFSRPGAPTITRDQADAVLEHLPPRLNEFMLSGGEPLVEVDLLLHLLREARRRFPMARLALQSNGDLLDAALLDELLAAGLDSLSIASADDWHPQPAGKFDKLRELLTSHGLAEARVGDPAATRRGRPDRPSFSIWGATPDFWVGGLWPRGRAQKYRLAKLMPEHNFCNRWSGALGFLDHGSAQQQIAVQLTSVYACCPGTVEPLGDLAQESLDVILARHQTDPVWQALNRGDPEGLGPANGRDRAYARERIAALGSVCLWCDEYFRERRKAGSEPLPVMGEYGHPERD